MFVEDLVALAVTAGQETSSRVIDAAGPETLAFRDLVKLVAQKVQTNARLIQTPPAILFGLATAMKLIGRDVVLTRDEISGLMAGLLLSQDPPTGTTSLSQWLDQIHHFLGKNYVSELRRHYR